MKVMIVEKPSMKRKMDAALGKEVTVVSSVGHIESLCDLEYYLKDRYEDNGQTKKFWSETLKFLPFIPPFFKHEITPEHKKVYETIENALRRATEIILGADPDREGELIHRNILEIAKNNGAVNTDKITRIWLHSETEKEIKKAFEERKSYTEYEGYYQAARIREIVDWLIGIQLTMLYSVKYGKAGRPVSIGRVQTWLLAEIVKRYYENKNFKPEPFYTFVFGTIDGVLFQMVDEENKKLRIQTKAEAEKIEAGLKGKQLQITDVKKKKFTEYAPSLYDLKTLQKEASAKHKISPDDTLKYAQSLYEKYDLISYPRTDCSVLSPQEAKELRNAMNLVYRFDEYKPLALAVKEVNPKLELNSKYIGKLEGHYAIIPVLSYDKNYVPTLSGGEKTIFDMIVKRFCATLLKPAQGHSTEFYGKIDDYSFIARFKNYTDLGYLEYTKNDSKKDTGAEGQETKPGEVEEKDKIISVNYKKNDSVSGSISITEEMTTAPKLFKDDTLLTLMEKAHLQIKDEALKKALKDANGIGTAATRAGFAPLLERRGYIVKNKGGFYTPTDLGRQLYEILPEELVIPDFSANLEFELAGFIKKNTKKTETDIVRETAEFLKKVFENSSRQHRFFNGKLSDKQIELVKKHGDDAVKKSLEEGDLVSCYIWINKFFDNLNRQKNGGQQEK